MLSRSGPLPIGEGWSFELKWEGFRAIVSTEDGLRVRSRRGWNMTAAVPELQQLPPGLVRDSSVPVTFVIFDLLSCDGDDLTEKPYSERRRLLESLDLRGSTWNGRHLR